MWSQYLRTRERNGIVAIFHELYPDPVYCTLRQWKELADGITGGIQMLIDDFRLRKLLVNSPKDDCLEFAKVAAVLESKLNQTTILYLMAAQGCNINCRYCPVPETAQRHGAVILSKEDAFLGINLWQEHLKETYNPDLQYFVIFYGGEPLLNRETIEASLCYMKMKKEKGALPPGINLMIATNGILIDNEMVALCKKYGMNVAVGLDGPKTVNDALKIDNNGDGTFDRIVAAIRLLVANGIRTFASVSITPYNVHQISGYSEFFRELGVEKFGFNFLKGRRLLELVGHNGLQNYYRQAAQGIIKNAQLTGKPGFEYQMEKKQNAFDRMDFYPVDCTCYGNQLVIQPDGQVSNCPFFKSQIGYVRNVGKNFRIWNQPIVKAWRKRLPLYHHNEAKALSGGGCAWSTYELKGDPLAADESSEIFAEEVLNELIWSKYDRLTSQKT